MAHPSTHQQTRALRWVQFALLAVCLLGAGVCVHAWLTGEIRMGGRYGGSPLVLRADSPALFWFIWLIWAGLAGLMAYGLWWLRRHSLRQT